MPAPKGGRPGPLAKRFWPGFLAEVFLVALVAALALAPRLFDGLSALAWTRYHVAEAARAPRPGEHARQAGHWAALALDALAPLPAGAEAARLAIGLGPSIEVRDRPAALTLYTEVRAELERLRTSRLRGLGLAELAAEAGRRAEAARPPGGHP
jgi:hypothetical protein